MPRMICTRAFKYGTRALAPNDEFDAETEEHATVLIAGNKARRKEVDEPQSERRRGAYKRRDLRAEH